MYWPQVYILVNGGAIPLSCVGPSVHLILSCLIASIFPKWAASCLRPQHSLHVTTFHILASDPATPLQRVYCTVQYFKPQMSQDKCSPLSSSKSGKTPLTMGARRSSFLEMDFALPFFSFFGDRGSAVVKVLCYKSEDRCFDPSWCHWNFWLA